MAVRTLPEPMRVFRIGDPKGKYPIYSGEGAAVTEGRWHNKGQEVIYASANYSTAMLEKLVPLVLLNAVAGKPIPVYGDGQQVRDWIHVQDHCEAVEIILRRGRPGETYHVGGGAPSTNLALIQQLCALLDDKRPNSPHRPHARLIQFVADRPAHDRRYDLNLEKIAATLDWSPRESLASGLAKTAEWYLGHLEWVDSVRQQPGYVEWLERNYGARERSA